MKKLVKPGTYTLKNGDELTRTQSGYKLYLIRRRDERQAKRFERLNRRDLLALAALPCYRQKHIKNLEMLTKEELIACLTRRPPVYFHLSWALTSGDPDAKQYLEMVRRETVDTKNESTKQNS